MSEFKELLKIADIHVRRIKMALKGLELSLPFDEIKVKNISDNELLFTELLINRFGKLQDLLGAKIITEFLGLKLENVDDLFIIDKINLLEKRGIIQDAEIWKEMRKARNHASHEYPEHPKLTALYLNNLTALAPGLIEIYENIKRSSI